MPSESSFDSFPNVLWVFLMCIKSQRAVGLQVLIGSMKDGMKFISSDVIIDPHLINYIGNL